MQLSNSEEQVMEHLWKLKKAFMKDILEAYPEPKPATTTLATLLKRMIDKKFVAYTEYWKFERILPISKKRRLFLKTR
jgi:BlaI family penicillinase repressor